MFVKKFMAPSVQQALEKVRMEFGPDALIFSTSQKKGAWFQPALAEVTAGWEATEPKKESKLSYRIPVQEEEKTEPSTFYSDGVSKYAKQPGVRSSQRRFEVYEKGFLRSGFSERASKDFARRLVLDFDVKELATSQDLEKARVYLVGEKLQVLSEADVVNEPGWLFTGMAGAGTTTLCVKLAMKLKSLKHRVCLGSLDRRKILGKRELVTYARLAGIRYQSEALAANSGIQILDGGGLGVGTSQTKVANTSVCLVIDATTRQDQMLMALRSAESLRPKAVAFTKVDLVQRPGEWYEALRQIPLPLLSLSQTQSFTNLVRFWNRTELSKYFLHSEEGC